MGRNRHLNKAREVKNDEFYTQLVDIEEELKHYTAHFKGKVVYCNCDDPRVSNFFHYFKENFERLELKKLIASCYSDIPPLAVEESQPAVFIEYDGGDVNIKQLKGDGDFRKSESLAFLDESDIVVTNPPFSLFRAHLAQVMAHKKSFLTIGHLTVLALKEPFALFRNQEIWLGVNRYDLDFIVSREPLVTKPVTARWYTNMDSGVPIPRVVLTEKYSQENYRKYDNCDAINVDAIKEIPIDYDGVIGVPITFLDKLNYNQFEIIGQLSGKEGIAGIPYDGRPFGLLDGKPAFARILIKHKRES